MKILKDQVHGNLSLLNKKKSLKSALMSRLIFASKLLNHIDLDIELNL
jgi:hypothetical protein